MGEIWVGYWNLQWKYLPSWVFVSGVCVLLAGIVVCVWRWGLRKGGRYSAGLLLVEYVLLIGSSLVLFRQTAETRAFELTPLGSYSKQESFVESLMNLTLFVPIGLLLGAAFQSMSWKKALIIGVCLSVGIELLQFVFKKGLAEFDDVMHNTVGCLIGYGIYYALYRIWIKMKA